MALLSQFERYEGYIFTECSLLYEGWFYVENSKSHKKNNIYIISLFFLFAGHQTLLFFSTTCHIEICFIYLINFIWIQRSSSLPNYNFVFFSMHLFLRYVFFYIISLTLN